MNISPEDFKKMQQTVEAKRVATPAAGIIKAKGNTKPRDRGMNKTEAAYARHLFHSDIAYYAFEPIKFRLADNTYYTPDFLVMRTDGSLRFVDTKAWWAGAKKVGVTEDALVKMKVVAEQFPMFTFLMTWERNGVWEERVF
jgi:hypothetical protein